MFNYIHFKNFKSLDDVRIDFTSKKKAKPLAIIYGENGSGKSNIVSGFYTLLEFSNTLSVNQIMNSMLEKFKEETECDDDADRVKELFINHIKKSHRDTDDIIRASKMIGSTENMSIEYGFEFNGQNGVYYLETDDTKVVKERLDFVVESKRGCYFEIDFNKNLKKLNNRVFPNKTYAKELNKLIEEYWGKHTLISILNHQRENKNETYMSERLSQKFIKILDLLLDFSCSMKEGISAERSSVSVSRKILTQLDKGEIPTNFEYELNNAEEFVNSIFTGLYSDIKEAYYKKDVKNNKIIYSLVFKKIIGGKIIDIDFARESTGTMTILKILPALYIAINGGIAIVDEFDSGIHDVLVRDIINEVYKTIEGQLIITTHNTLLLEEKLLKDSIYFLVIEPNGSKDVYNINDYDLRTHPNHNMRDLYLKGFYDAIPNTGDFDLDIIKRKFNGDTIQIYED